MRIMGRNRHPRKLSFRPFQKSSAPPSFPGISPRNSLSENRGATSFPWFLEEASLALFSLSPPSVLSSSSQAAGIPTAHRLAQGHKAEATSSGPLTQSAQGSRVLFPGKHSPTTGIAEGSFCNPQPDNRSLAFRAPKATPSWFHMNGILVQEVIYIPGY